MHTIFRTAIAPKLSVLACFALIAACGQRPQGAAAPAQPSEASFKEAGAYEMHFNAVRSDTVAPEVARAYGIERSKNRVMLNVTVLHKDAASSARKPVEATVTVDARNLNGQLKTMEVRRVNEGDAIYYIGETGISGSEILVFDIKATPSGESTPITAQLRREFFSD
jgi:esterase/lipase superfamily enzyme